MRFKVLVLLFIISSSNANIIKPIDYVNPKYFSGLWYEIARTYNSYQHDCVASSVEYQFKDSNNYKVFNRCFKNKIGGELIEYKGKAKSLTKENMAQMKLTYFWVFSKKYSVIYLNNYKSAVITDKDLNNLWIMSRTPKMSKKEFEKIVNILKPKMDTSKLIITLQDKRGKYK